MSDSRVRLLPAPLGPACYVSAALGAVLTWTPIVGSAPGGEEAPAPAVQRIVTIAPNAAEIICALGAGDSIVGVSKFCTYPPEILRRPRGGGLFDPDLERIIALRPDLVVLRGRSESVEQLCDRRKIDIYHDRTEKLGDIETCIRDLGHRLGRDEEGARLARGFRARIEAVRKRVVDRPRPRVLLTISRQPDRLANLLTTGRGTFLDEALAIAGGVNVFGHVDMDYPQISPEGIVARRPDVIVELMPEVKLTEDLRRQMLEQWHALESIPAVRASRIYFITEDNALIPSPRYVEIIESLSRILHSEVEVEP